MQEHGRNRSGRRERQDGDPEQQPLSNESAMGLVPARRKKKPVGKNPQLIYNSEYVPGRNPQFVNGDEPEGGRKQYYSKTKKQNQPVQRQGGAQEGKRYSGQQRGAHPDNPHRANRQGRQYGRPMQGQYRKPLEDGLQQPDQRDVSRGGRFQRPRPRNAQYPQPGQHQEGQQRTGQQRTGHQRSGQHRTGQQRTGQHGTGQQPSGQQRSGQQRTGPQRFGQQRAGQQRTGPQRGRFQGKPLQRGRSAALGQSRRVNPKDLGHTKVYTADTFIYKENLDPRKPTERKMRSRRNRPTEEPPTE